MRQPWQQDFSPVCGGSSGNETTAAASAAEGTTAASTATDKTGDYSDKVITYGLTTAWDTVNPYGSTSGSIYQNLVCDKLYDRLAFIEEAGSGVITESGQIMGIRR